MTKLIVDPFWPMLIAICVYAVGCAVLVRYLEWKND